MSDLFILENIPVVFMIDHKYVMPLAVALKSLYNNTSRTVSVFVIDLNLSNDDRNILSSVVPTGQRQIEYLKALTDCPLLEKLHLPKSMPPSIGRVIYLDADILIRTDLGCLWNDTASIRSVAAVLDFGHPKNDLSYFNAGVMVINLTYLRENDLTTRMSKYVEEKGGLDSFPFKEQDVLNHFFPEWHRLPYEYNAQGLDSYIRYRRYAGLHHPALFNSDDEVEKLVQNAYIVHFTGAAEVSLSSYHPFCKMPLKPWSGGNLSKHPYNSAWFTTLRSIPEYQDWRPDAIVCGKKLTKEVESLTDMITREHDHFFTKLEEEYIQSLGSETLAIFLPLTSRGSALVDQKECMMNLSKSLPNREKCKVFFAIDHDDPIYANHEGEQILQECFSEQDIHIELFETVCKPPAICQMVNQLAKKAYKEDFFYFLLLGDDVILHTKRDSLLPAIREKFSAISRRTNAPFGFGCVSFEDDTSIGFPTFPIVTRLHLKIFDEQWCPSEFINQDADPYLFELYRHFGAAAFSTSLRLSNSIGGADQDNTRYDRHHIDWKYELLAHGVQRISEYFQEHSLAPLRSYLRLDVIIPSYRLQRYFIDNILEMEVPAHCETTFIIILDNPTDEARQIKAEYEKKYKERVRIRINETNRGASYTRSRGMNESCARWILFLDDDVIPKRNLLAIYAQEIHRSGDRYAGYVGCTKMIKLDQQTNKKILYWNEFSWYSKSIQLVHLLHFWSDHIESGGELAPWGITAQLVIRNTRERFNEVFPKTGGGEDIDLCLRTCRKLSLKLKNLPQAVCYHPWWNDNYPFISRFYGWAVGDSILLDIYPEHTYRSYWNGLEMAVVASISHLVILIMPFVYHSDVCDLDCVMKIMFSWMISVVSIFTADISYELYRIMIDDAANLSMVRGFERLLCGFIGIVRYRIMGADVGHFIAPLMRHRSLAYFGIRYDWWCGQNPIEVRNTVRREGTLFLYTACLLLAVHRFGWSMVAFW